MIRRMTLILAAAAAVVACLSIRPSAAAETIAVPAMPATTPESFANRIVLIETAAGESEYLVSPRIESIGVRSFVVGPKLDERLNGKPEEGVTYWFAVEGVVRFVVFDNLEALRRTLDQP